MVIIITGYLTPVVTTFIPLKHALHALLNIYTCLKEEEEEKKEEEEEEGDEDGWLLGFSTWAVVLNAKCMTVRLLRTRAVVPNTKYVTVTKDQEEEEKEEEEERRLPQSCTRAVVPNARCTTARLLRTRAVVPNTRYLTVVKEYKEEEEEEEEE